jgi:DNA-binding NarL/FixJ family response regulator
MSSKKTVLIVDDHPLIREGVISILEAHPMFEVVGEAGNAKEGFEKTKELRPDFVIVDIVLPDESGIELASNIQSLLPDIRIVILSVHSKIGYITRAFQAGASGYVVKESVRQKLVECLEAVSIGQYFMDSSISENVVEYLIRSGAPDLEVSDKKYITLTPREQEVTRLLAEGLSGKEIAERLFISPKTVENHRTNIMGKLDVHTTVALIRYAARIGLIDESPWKD